MNQLKLSKADIKNGFYIITSVSVFCFVSGFMTARLFDRDPTQQLDQLGTMITSLQTLNASALEANSISRQISNQLTNTIELEKTLTPITPTPPLVEAKPYAIQAGVFQSFDNATSLQTNLNTRGILTAIINNDHDNTYRVILEQFSQETEAKNALNALRARYQMPLYLTRLQKTLAANIIAAN